MFPCKISLLPAIGVVIALFGVPAQAQGLGLDLDLGGSGVSVGIGGGDGIGVDLDIGDDSGLDLQLGGDGSGDGSIARLLDSNAGDGLTLTQEQALDAVRRRRALPLEDILLRAQLLTDGDVIDAQLIAVQDVLLYEIKVLSRAGGVSELYFYARSGLPVE